MGRGLVRHHVETLAPPDQFGLDFGGIPDQRDRLRPTFRGGGARPRESLIEGTRQAVDVTHVPAPGGACLVNLDNQGHTLVHRHGQRLRAAHAAQTCG